MGDVMKQSKSRQPSCLSFSSIQSAVQYLLIIQKLHVFMFIAKILKAFLLNCQTNEPMKMFLGEDLYSLCQKLLEKSIKKSVVENADKMYKLA